MIRYFIIAIMLYLLFLACYLLWERSVKRKWNAAKKPAPGLFRTAPKDDIIGKSKFTLRHSAPQDDTLKIRGKASGNTLTFADGTEKKEVPNTPAAIPADELDKVFSSHPPVDDSGEIDIEIDDEPEGEYEPEEDVGGIDTDESEEADEAAGGSLATGLIFDDLSDMVRTVNNPEAATPEEKEDAGRVLVEVRKTDMFEQVVSGQPQKKVAAGKLMDDYFAAYYRRKREAGEVNDEPSVKAPEDFDVRAFA